MAPEPSGLPRGSTTTLIAVAILAVFVATLFGPDSGTALELAPGALAAHGANLPGATEPLRDLTSLLVHGGMFHVLMAMFTVVMVGGLLEQELGHALVIPVFLVTGGAGAAASDWLGRDGLGLGAAAGVIGMIGAGAMIGHRAGTRRGITYRNELLSVGVLVIGFGLFVGTDYRALVPAALVGAGLGWLVPWTGLVARPWPIRVIGVIGVLALLGLAVIAAVPLIADLGA